MKIWYKGKFSELKEIYEIEKSKPCKSRYLEIIKKILEIEKCD